MKNLGLVLLALMSTSSFAAKGDGGFFIERREARQAKLEYLRSLPTKDIVSSLSNAVVTKADENNEESQKLSSCAEICCT